ncbi:hypothetical protein [Metabacillus iocasae]|uniref:Uncharacterized protein n=1 Tax=Priestia iocasae TaxID=2291674 RepID=A0ABS2QRK7_9BACI|nr:hypothetical protein [Metabacillus iocasae]MBM7702074.1 hypothetical protein [Metabacillus iocasae]
MFNQFNRFPHPQTWGYYGFSPYNTGPWHNLHTNHYHLYYLNPALMKSYTPHQAFSPYQGFPFVNGN